MYLKPTEEANFTRKPFVRNYNLQKTQVGT